MNGLVWNNMRPEALYYTILCGVGRSSGLQSAFREAQAAGSCLTRKVRRTKASRAKRRSRVIHNHDFATRPLVRPVLMGVPEDLSLPRIWMPFAILRTFWSDPSANFIFLAICCLGANIGGAACGLRNSCDKVISLARNPYRTELTHASNNMQ
jgi:hypothetical protein